MSDAEPIAFGEEEFLARREALCRAMREREIDALVIAPGANLFYLAGYWGRISRRFTALVLGAMDESQIYFTCPGFESGLHMASLTGVVEVRTWERTDVPQAATIQAFTDWGFGGAGKVAVDPQLPWFQTELFLKNARGCEFVSGADLLASVRMIKSPQEIEHMRRATRDATEAILLATGNLATGVREDALEKQFLGRVRAVAEPTDSWILMLFGPSSAEPHGFPERRALAGGDVVLFDFGTTRSRYHSDTTRTVFFGEVEDEAKRVWDTVREAYLAARTAARPGVTFNDVDAAARKVISDAGYGANFTHGIGHGIGLEIHEPPYPEPISDATLRPGATITIEPGIYLPGRFGVRLEDTVFITEDGCEPIDPDPPMGHGPTG